VPRPRWRTPSGSSSRKHAQSLDAEHLQSPLRCDLEFFEAMEGTETSPTPAHPRAAARACSAMQRNLWPASSQSRRQLPLSNMFGFSCQLSALRRQSKYRMYITAGKGEDARRLRCAVNSPLSSLRPHASRILPDNISANAAGIYRIGVWQSCLLSALRCGFSHPPGCLQLRNNVMNLAHTGGDTPSTSTARSSCAFIVKCGENIGVSERTHRKTAG
jgi:hypothetical protein